MPKVIVAAVAVATLGAAIPAAGSSGQVTRPGNPALRMALNAERGIAPPRLPNGHFIPLLSGAYVRSAEEAGAVRSATAVQPAVAAPTIGTTGCSNVFRADGAPNNVRANQDCGYRFQSEEWVAVNPADPTNVVVSQNDSSLSGNHTGVDFSVDGGKHFGDSRLPSGRITIPEAPGGVWSFDFFSDPVHTFDARGNLYYVTLGADFAQDGFDGVFAWKANSCLKGSALHTPGSGSCSPFRPPLDATAVPIRTNFGNPSLFDDKELIASDTSRTSRFQGNVYVTWTIFNFSCGSDGASFCDAPIFFSRSTNGGQSWSSARQISGSSPICKFGNFFDPSQQAHACNNDQFSDPVVAPDGTIYVFFNNYNTDQTTETSPSGLFNQILMVKSVDGGVTWSSPTRVTRDFGTEPYSLPGHEIQDCDLFRQCLPPNGYRMADYPSAGIGANGKLAVYWSDFRNGGPCAVDKAPVLKGLPITPCANYNTDILVTTSTNGGASWSDPRQVTTNRAAQWQPWGAVGPAGALHVAYYDRKYGQCEATGCNDITLASSDDNGAEWSYRRITTSSMPNATCALAPTECGFLGDYMGLAIDGNRVHIAWGDTRGLNGTVEEDVYYASLPACTEDSGGENRADDCAPGE
jgi:hypothetical protein